MTVALWVPPIKSIEPYEKWCERHPLTPLDCLLVSYLAEHSLCPVCRGWGTVQHRVCAHCGGSGKEKWQAEVPEPPEPQPRQTGPPPEPCHWDLIEL